MKMSPEFRHLEQASDGARMREFFQAHVSRFHPGGGGLREVRVTRVFPRGRGGFVIQYELEFDRRAASGEQTHIVCGELSPSGASLPSWAEKHRDRVVVDSDLGLVVPIFPFDPELPSLADWIAPDRAAKKLKDALSPLGGAWAMQPRSEPALTLLAYRLGRRCTVRYDLDFGPADRRALIARISRPGSLAARLEGRPWERTPVASPDGSTAPWWVQALVVQDQEGIELLPLAPGRSLHDLIALPALEQACGEAGRVLARIHATPPGPLPARSESGELANLHRQVSLACTIFPDRASLFEEAMSVWAGRKTMRLGADTLIHGDFYDKQVLYSPLQVTVVDYDALASGEPAMDVGNFSAHMTLRRMQHPESAAHVERGREAFEKAYPVVRNEFLDRCRFWETATLIRLAALYALRPRWRHLTVPLLEESRQCLAHRS